ncbi:RuvC-like resolvase [Streptomyces phage Xkcd426]|nr:RuvC-like resolvase [Streptomyces phage Xkcd426]
MTQHAVSAAGDLRIVGLDLSVTSAGMSDGRTHWVTQTSSDDPIEYRLDRIVVRAMAFVHGAGDWGQDADLVVIESGAFSRGAQNEGAEWLSALRYLVRVRLWQGGFPFAMVTPTTLKAYTAGHGKATKAEMVSAVFNRHGVDLSKVMVKDGRYDMADALALAAMGYAQVGQPLKTEGPPPPRKSLLAVKWPHLHLPEGN